MPPYRRALSPLERLWLTADRLLSPFVNQLVLEGAGELDVERWRGAVDHASAANPGSRVALRGHLAQSRWVDLGASPPVRPVDGRGWSGADPEGAPFLSDPLPPRTGPTSEVLLVDGDPPRVVFRTHHATMDGRGTLVWVDDVFRCLRGEEPVGASSTATDLELARRLVARRWRVPAATPSYLAPTGRPEPSVEGTRWARRRVDGRFSLLLPTVASLVGRATHGRTEGRVMIHVPVDLRPRFPEVRSTANLTGLLELEVGREATPESIADGLRAGVAGDAAARFVADLAPVRHLPLRGLARRVRRARARMQAGGLYNLSASLSNLGLLPMASFRGGGFEARAGFFVPPGATNVPLFLALAGDATGVELVATMPRSLATDGRLEALLEEIAAGVEARAAAGAGAVVVPRAPAERARSEELPNP